MIFCRSDRIRGQPDKNIKEWNFKSFTNSRDGSTGFNTNNLVELEGLIQGLRLVSKEGWFLVTIEGYSKVIIQMARKISMGQKVEKLTIGWRLLSRLETLSCLISTCSASSFGHVRREANKVADLMANVGVEGGQDLKEGMLQELEGEVWVD